jgi:hypothetical protein
MNDNNLKDALNKLKRKGYRIEFLFKPFLCQPSVKCVEVESYDEVLQVVSGCIEEHSIERTKVNLDENRKENSRLILSKGILTGHERSKTRKTMPDDPYLAITIQILPVVDYKELENIIQPVVAKSKIKKKVLNLQKELADVRVQELVLRQKIVNLEEEIKKI